MTCDLLSICVSIVASELTFGASGRVVNEYRSKLSRTMLQAFMCTSSWKRVLIRNQDLKEKLNTSIYGGHVTR